MSDRETPPWLQPVPDGDEATGLFSGKMTYIVAGAAILLILLFAVAVVVFGTSDQAGTAPRLITAPADPIKQRPEGPGGRDIANQDKEIFEKADGSSDTIVPTLGTQPEQPLAEIPAAPVDNGEAAAIPESAQAALDEVIDTVSKPDSPASKTPVSDPKPVDTKLDEQPAAPSSESTTTSQQAPAPERADPVSSPTQPATLAGGLADGFKIQLGAYGSRARAESAWPVIRNAHRELLADLVPFYEAVQSGERTLFRLRAGNVAARDEADRICLALKGKGQGCIVVAP